MENRKLNLEIMKQENVVVHCDTEDKAIKLLTALKEEGYVWYNSWKGLNQDLLEDIKYYKYHKSTCYRVSDLIEKKISFSCYEFYQTDNFKIIPFVDLLEAQEYLTTEEIDASLDIVEQEEVETVSKEEIITQLSTKKYLVSVVGGKAPKHIHNSLESAEKEAKRLASKQIGKEVMVLEYVKSYQAKVIVEEI